MSTETTELIVRLLSSMEAAIESGDWKVDGANDPDCVMHNADRFLRNSGYTRDGLTGTEWIKD